MEDLGNLDPSQFGRRAAIPNYSGASSAGDELSSQAGDADECEKKPLMDDEKIDFNYSAAGSPGVTKDEYNKASHDTLRKSTDENEIADHYVTPLGECCMVLVALCFFLTFTYVIPFGLAYYD